MIDERLVSRGGRPEPNHFHCFVVSQSLMNQLAPFPSPVVNVTSGVAGGTTSPANGGWRLFLSTPRYTRPRTTAKGILRDRGAPLAWRGLLMASERGVALRGAATGRTAHAKVCRVLHGAIFPRRNARPQMKAPRLNCGPSALPLQVSPGFAPPCRIADRGDERMAWSTGSGVGHGHPRANHVNEAFRKQIRLEGNLRRFSVQSALQI